MLRKYTKIPHLLLAIIAASVFSIYFGHDHKIDAASDLVLMQDGTHAAKNSGIDIRAILLVPWYTFYHYGNYYKKYANST